MAIWNAKKATNEAKKLGLKRKRDEAREGAPYLI